MNAQPHPDGRDDPDGRIAVVGMAGRFPGADSADALWELLASGREAITRFTPEELASSGVPETEAAHPGYVPAKGVLEDIAGFDSHLFGYSALEASVIDPQQRIFLECVWAALEDAGCDPDRAPGPVGIYAGSLLSTYLIHQLLPRTDLRQSLGVPVLFQGNQPDQLAARAAYKLNLRGPAVSVQTACSTSLVAVHLAAQSLLAQECDVAVAGGVTVTVPHRTGYRPVEGGIESADGHCRPYGAGADGTVFGNGAGAVVLKRLADALADGDRIHAVILGSAVNNDGASKAGYTAPGVSGQAAVVREALAVSGVSPRTIGYVEGHGTGTPIGDPIEVEALTLAYRAAEENAGEDTGGRPEDGTSTGGDGAGDRTGEGAGEAAEETAGEAVGEGTGGDRIGTGDRTGTGTGGGDGTGEAVGEDTGGRPEDGGGDRTGTGDGAEDRTGTGEAAPGPWCALGSVKSNLGHLDTAAGITGFIKAVQVLRHGRVPASLHADPPHPDLRLETTPFFVPAGLTDWPLAGGPRRAAVSAFGIGGTNAHVVLEQAPPAAAGDRPAAAEPALPTALPVALPLSAHTATALDAAAERLADHLDTHPRVPLADVAHTLRTGRRQLAHRHVVLAGGTAEAVAALRGHGRPASVRARAGRGDAPVAFLLPGQGALPPGTATGLHRAHPVFREALDTCARILRPHLGRDLVDLLENGGEEELRRTAVVQPATVALGYALARLWEHWGVRPAALLGHSLGELTAALLAGVLDLPDALAAVAARGRLMEETEPGAMLAVPLAETDAAEAAAAHGLDVAAVNGPRATVLSGPLRAVERAAADLETRGLRPVRLPVDRAFHSALCAEAAERFAEELSKAVLHTPRTPFVSGATGAWITADQATDPAYWGRQMRTAVRFHQGLRQLAGLDEHLVLVENGPGSTLTDLVRSVFRGVDGPPLAPPPLPSRGRRTAEDEPRSAVLSLAGLWTHGASVGWEPAAPGARVTGLPGYPFQRQPHWIEPDAAPGHGAAPAPARKDTQGTQGTQDTKGAEDAAGKGVPGERAEEGAGAVHARLRWRPLAPGPDTAPDTDPLLGRRRTWLVLMDPEGGAQPVADTLTARGHIVTVVRPGPEYRRVRRGVYELNPADPAQYTKLLADLRALVRTPTAVLYAWGLDPVWEGEDRETAGYFGLIRLARAMAEESVVNEVRLGVLTAGAFRTADEERPDAAAAALSGPVQVLPEEYRNLRCVQVDLPADARPEQDTVPEVLRAVLTAPAPLLALRGGRLLTRTAERVERLAPAVPARVRRGGVWVITGGFGGLGRTFARYLAHTCGARLALLGRRPAPATGPAADLVARLRADGTDVLTLQADVTDAASLSRALERVREELGGIDGAVHAAGVPGGGSVERRGDREMRAVLGPKTAGVRNLLAALRPGEAEALVLCSSLATLVPTYGQADYAAGNAYLAAVGEAEAARGARHAVAVDWDMWAGAGMADEAEVPVDLKALQEHMLAGALTPAQGTRAFAALLDGPPGRAVVARAGAEVTDGGALRLASEPAGPAGSRTGTPALPRPELTTPYTAPRTPTEERLAGIYGEMLGIDRVGVHDDFLELGGHSLLAAQVVARLRAEFEVEIPARLFFEGGRIADLAVEIEDRILAELENQ